MSHATFDKMTSWSAIVEKAQEIFSTISESHCLFRGQHDATWHLTPGIFRYPTAVSNEKEYFAGFVASSQRYVPRDACSWETLFYIQHHGGPTRLLDWTASFSTAVYFSIPQTEHDFSVWVLDASQLNEHSIGYPFFETYSRFGNGQDYVRDFLNGNWRPTPIAIKPPRFNARVIAQDSYFTFTARDTPHLEQAVPGAFTQIVVPANLRSDAIKWLKFLALDRAILFPDADGLTKAMNESFRYA